MALSIRMQRSVVVALGVKRLVKPVDPIFTSCFTCAYAVEEETVLDSSYEGPRRIAGGCLNLIVHRDDDLVKGPCILRRRDVIVVYYRVQKIPIADKHSTPVPPMCRFLLRGRYRLDVATCAVAEPPPTVMRRVKVLRY